jgi:hypothetical protein
MLRDHHVERDIDWKWASLDGAIAKAPDGGPHGSQSHRSRKQRRPTSRSDEWPMRPRGRRAHGSERARQLDGGRDPRRRAGAVRLVTGPLPPIAVLVEVVVDIMAPASVVTATRLSSPVGSKIEIRFVHPRHAASPLLQRHVPRPHVHHAHRSVANHLRDHVAQPPGVGISSAIFTSPRRIPSRPIASIASTSPYTPGLAKSDFEDADSRSMAAHRKLGPDIQPITKDKMRQRLGKQLPRILAERRCDRLRLEIAIEPGKVRLCAWPAVAGQPRAGGDRVIERARGPTQPARRCRSLIARKGRSTIWNRIHAAP